jgi:hypothetical protein
MSAALRHRRAMARRPSPDAPRAKRPAFQALRLRADAPPLAGPARHARAFGAVSIEEAS